MKMILRYISRYKWLICLTAVIKLLATMCELSLPYILEYIVDDIAPAGQFSQVILFGILMFLVSVFTRIISVIANNMAISNAHNISFDIRQDLFEKTENLSGAQFDHFALPSLISRMSSDSYNVQTGVQQLQSLCIRSPIMLLGGIIMMMIMDFALSRILLILLPFLILIVIIIGCKGIPMYTAVQSKLDQIVRIMRENITGIRVVKALSKENFERDRFASANDAMTQTDVKANTVMSLPQPILQLLLNMGLVLTVVYGGQRVNSGSTQPGVLLAFLTYFNMITMGILGLSRIFVTLSKANASGNRIDAVLQTDTSENIIPFNQAKMPSGNEFIRFEHVDFNYGATGDKTSFAGFNREKCLDDISFAIKKGGSLGIIGPTGSGKSTIIHLMMRFYDADAGGIFIGGRDVRTYEKDELHQKFGTVFQNDMVFHETIMENIRFGRNLDEETVKQAASDAMAEEFISKLDDGMNYKVSIKGANLSGGQKQRLLVARALAGSPEILVLDDASSALDYKTDAAMRKAIISNHPDSTLILIAQRVSSVMNMDQILVLDHGHCIALGSHEQLLNTCAEYREIYETQMGDATIQKSALMKGVT